MIRQNKVTAATLAFTRGMTAWTALSNISEFAGDLQFGGASQAPPPLPGVGISPSAPASTSAAAGAAPVATFAPAANTPGAAGEMVTTRYGIHYQVMGHEMQFVEILLDPGQTIVAEAGSMMFMSQGIQLDTVLGDGSAQNQGFLDKVFEAGKRVFTGATLFLTTFTASGISRETAAFSAPYPGKIVPLDLSE